MIDRPHVDHEPLEAAAGEGIAMVEARDPVLVTIAEQFGDDVAAWVRSLHRDDQGLPSAQHGADEVASGTVEANALAPNVISGIDALIEVIRQGATAGADEAARAAARDACRTVAIALDAAPSEPNPVIRPAARARNASPPVAATIATAPTASEPPHTTARTIELECMHADELAAFLGVNRKTVYDYAARAVIPCRRLGRRIVFSRAAILSWLARHPASVGT